LQPLVVHDGLAAALFWTCAGAWLLGELLALMRSRRMADAKADSELSQVLLMAALLGGLGLGYLAAAKDAGPGLPDGGWWPLILGLAMLGAGVALRAWAILTLGRFFQYTVVVQEGQRVIESGPYRRIRHPSYSGLLLAMLGLGIALDNVLGIAACLLPALVAFSLRLLSEERVLARELGEPYRDYMRRTDRLIPGVW
jgi:protein-S-isoprenylcysteine O-methyltransferase Ste14